MVVSRVLRDVARKLRHANLLREVPLEGRIQNLALRRLQSVHHARDGALQIVVAEVNQVLVDEIAVRQAVSSGNQGRAVVALEPVLAVVCTLLVEGQVDGRV